MFKRWRERKQRYAQLFNDENQHAIREDLTTFFGPRADHYLHTYEKMRAKNGGTPLTWSWPAFFGSFVWFFYRKLYLIGSLIIVLPIVLGLLFPSANAGMWLVFAMFGKTMYVNAGMGRILKADELGLHGAERTDYLTRAGGVSLAAGILAGLLYATLLALGIWAVATELQAIK